MIEYTQLKRKATLAQVAGGLVEDVLADLRIGEVHDSFLELDTI